MLPNPVHSEFILTRHDERVKATKDRLTLKLTSLRDERGDIAIKMAANPTERAVGN